MHLDDEHLTLAAAIADGTAVDWSEAESRARALGNVELVQRLRALSRLADVHRRSDELTASVDSRQPTAPPGPMSSSEESVTTLLAGRFVIERRLGAGGFGVVYQAYDRTRRVQLAIKSLHRSDVAAIYDLKREFRSLADLSHPNLVSLYELFGEGDQWFIAMELVRGADFLSYVRKGIERAPDRGPEADTVTFDRLPCDVGRLEQVATQLAQAIVYLHANGKLHRDIKPSNVLITEAGKLKLLDFGLAIDLSVDPAVDTLRFHGTPAYISPEQAAGESPTEASDWYSVGVMLFEALTGQRPFSGTFAQVIEAKAHRDAPRARSIVPIIPEPLDALCRDLLQRRASNRPRDDEVFARLQQIWPATIPPQMPTLATRRERPTFVGRHTHLDTLHRAFDQSIAGRVQVAFVEGASGMGKTSLVRHFVEQLRDRDPDVVVLEGRCYERESVPYKALDSLVDRLSRYLKTLSRGQVEALLPRDVTALTRLFPVLRRLDAVANVRHRAEKVANAQELRRRGFAAFRELLARLTDRHPVVLVIDDLQWGDTDSAGLIADLVRKDEAPPMLFIACYRSEEAFTSAALKTLLFRKDDSTAPSLEDVHHVVVDQLTEAEAQELATTLARVHHTEVPAARIAVESERSPFFINQLVRYAATRTEAQAAADSAGSPSEGLLDLTLDSVIATRINELSVAARRLLEVLALYGAPLKLSSATEVAELSAGGLHEVTMLRSAHLTRTRFGSSGEEIELYHDRIREAVRSLIPEAQARQLHERLATVLERAPGTDPEVLVVHFSGAGARDTAAVYAVVAADRARDALAFDRAAKQYRLALEYGTFEPERRHAIQIKLASALAASGRGYDAAQAYLAAAEGALAAELLELKRRAAEQLLRSGHIDEGVNAIRSVLAELQMNMPSSPMRALLALAFQRTRIRLRGLGYQERDRSQLSTADLVRVDACWSVATAIGVVDTIYGAYFQARHLLLALETGDPHRVARALAVEITYTALGGSHARSRQEQLTTNAQLLAERVGRPETIALVTLCRGVAAYFQGQWKSAKEILAQSDPMLRECSGVAWELDTVYLYYALTLFYLGEIDDLTTRLPVFLREARERDDLTAETNLRTRTTYIIHLAADNPVAAQQEVDQGMAGSQPGKYHAQHSWELYARGEIDLYCGRGQDAWNRVREQWGPLQRSLLLRIQAVRIESRYLRARSALAAVIDAARPTSRRRSLIATAKRDARHLARENVGWATALAHLIRAGVASIAGQPKAAIACLLEAESAFRDADMLLHVHVAQRQRGALLGGADGDGLAQEADRWMNAQGIRKPEDMARMLAPIDLRVRAR